jgi:hypothetical protein
MTVIYKDLQRQVIEVVITCSEIIYGLDQSITPITNLIFFLRS